MTNLPLFNSTLSTFLDNFSIPLPSELKIVGADTAFTFKYKKKVAGLLDSVSLPAVPEYYKCPITEKIMEDPVVASDGWSYESSALKKVYLDCMKKEMAFSTKVTGGELYPYAARNIALKRIIQGWVENSSNGFDMENVETAS